MTDHFYQTLPYDFGLKRPTNLDHLRRVKDKVKLLEVISDICLAEKSLLNALVSSKQSFTLTNLLSFIIIVGSKTTEFCLSLEVRATYQSEAYQSL